MHPMIEKWESIGSPYGQKFVKSGPHWYPSGYGDRLETDWGNLRKFESCPVRFWVPDRRVLRFGFDQSRFVSAKSTY